MLQSSFFYSVLKPQEFHSLIKKVCLEEQNPWEPLYTAILSRVSTDSRLTMDALITFDGVDHIETTKVRDSPQERHESEN